MNISAIIAATILVAAVGLFIGVFLGAAGKKDLLENAAEGNVPSLCILPGGEAHARGEILDLGGNQFHNRADLRKLRQPDAMDRWPDRAFSAICGHHRT